MFLKRINEVCKYENGDKSNPNDVYNYGLFCNPNWKDYDINDRSHWAYVGLNDEEFEGKKKIFESFKHFKEMEENGSLEVEPEAYSGWYNYGGNWLFFEVHENENDTNPVAYLVISVVEGDIVNDYPEFSVCKRAMALADEVVGWEMGKIQALLLNRLFSDMYNLSFNENNTKPLREHTVVAFDGNSSRRLKASCEKDGFVVCKSEFNANLSQMEKDEYRKAFAK